jgi:hypothetical protein
MASGDLGAAAPTGVAGLEPATGRLTAVSSTTELHANVGAAGLEPATECVVHVPFPLA